MQNNTNKKKSTGPSLKTTPSANSKLMRHSVAKLPKHLDSACYQKSPYSKLKTLPIRSLRQITYSFIPADFRLPQTRTNVFEGYKQGFSETAIFHSRSDQTLDDKTHTKEGKKRSKKGKINIRKNRTKQDQKYQLERRGTLTTRKSSVKKDIYQDILLKTERVIKKYQMKQIQWRKEKEGLLQQIQGLKRKSNIRTMTSSASSYNTKRYLY